jgi:TM2 domain-containing membrane protein YozV
MYCTSCGNQFPGSAIPAGASVNCPTCGVPLETAIVLEAAEVQRGQQFKKCPFCAEQIAAEAIKCRFCGSMLPMPDASRRPGDDHLIWPKAKPDSPIVIALASTIVITGLGQMVVGQVAKGVVFLLGSVVLAVLTFGLSLLVTWPLIGIDAYMVARKLKAGKPVSKWECFPTR